MRKLWKVELEWGDLFWDRYEGFIISAETEQEARSFLPNSTDLCHDGSKRVPLSITCTELSSSEWNGIIITDYRAG